MVRGHFWTTTGRAGYDPAMPTDFTANNCGGAAWKTHPGGLIEVETLGLPIVQPGDASTARSTSDAVTDGSRAMASG